MKRHTISRLAAISAFVAACAPFAAAADEQSAGERELAEILEGRVAGEPVKCLRSSESDRMQVIDDTAFVFRDGATIYVNRPRGAEILDDSDLPVFRQFGSQLCRLDQVELRDRISGMPGPVIVLDTFTPYTKAAGADAGEGG
ncbi:hypothetical protein [Pelagerythrobacter sp.]|uniref:hypothetical protein n=1 Tax=Pelagerythrobacter sp. TaxID=2800702 RepID=UPI0035AD9E3A